MADTPSQPETPDSVPAPAKRPGEDSMPSILPLLPLADIVVFPGMIAPLVVNTTRSIKLVDLAEVEDALSH